MRSRKFENAKGVRAFSSTRWSVVVEIQQNWRDSVKHLILEFFCTWLMHRYRILPRQTRLSSAAQNGCSSFAVIDVLHANEVAYFTFTKKKDAAPSFPETCVDIFVGISDHDFHTFSECKDNSSIFSSPLYPVFVLTFTQ